MRQEGKCIELADIFREHASTYQRHYKLWPEHQKVMDSVIECRTRSLGGHLDHCDRCGHTRPSYNSCRNRHCPKCQFMRKTKWVDKLAANLPPVKHFHLVFTIPPALSRLFYLNQRTAYGLLFKAAGESVSKCALNPNFLGGQMGAVAILHTWTQTLVYHPHIHMIVPAGGLSQDGMEWVGLNTKFFLPVKMLSRVFRGMLVRLMEKAVRQGLLKLPDEHPDFASIKSKCYERNWVVYCQRPFANHQRLLEYLGSYTHRVAISNNRIKALDEGKVRFAYKGQPQRGNFHAYDTGRPGVYQKIPDPCFAKGFLQDQVFWFYGHV